MTKPSKYTVKLMHNFEYDSRWRAGVQFGRGEVKVLELTDEQVQEFKNDRYFEIKKGASKDKSGNAEQGAEVLQSTEADAQDANATPETSQDSVSSEEESSISPLEALLQHSREELNTMAVEAGVASPEQLPNKTAVAEAILQG